MHLPSLQESSVVNVANNLKAQGMQILPCQAPLAKKCYIIVEQTAPLLQVSLSLWHGELIAFMHIFQTSDIRSEKRHSTILTAIKGDRDG